MRSARLFAAIAAFTLPSLVISARVGNVSGAEISKLELGNRDALVSSNTLEKRQSVYCGLFPLGTTCTTGGTGVASGYCSNGRCILNCQTNYLVSADNRSCIRSDTTQNCQQLGNQCATLGNGVTSSSCTSNGCAVTCQANYTPSSDNKSCIPNCLDGTVYDPSRGCVRRTCSVASDCRQYTSASNPSTCYAGQCYIYSTNTSGGIPLSGQCAARQFTPPGDDNTCANGLICIDYKCQNVGLTDNNNCGSVAGNVCTTTGTGVTGGSCQNGACTISCAPNYIPSADKKSCVPNNTVLNCATLGNQCTTSGTGVVSGSCSSGRCVLTCATNFVAAADNKSCVCASGYTPSADGRSCVIACKDGTYLTSNGFCTRRACSTQADCNTLVPGQASTCTAGYCFTYSTNPSGLPATASCGLGGEVPPGDDNSCAAGLICINYKCTNLGLTDVNNCGGVRNNACTTTGPNVLGGSCQNGQCTIQCAANYVPSTDRKSCVLAASNRRARRGPVKNITLCPNQETACPIAGSASFAEFVNSKDKVADFLHSRGGFECISTDISIESCGGCASTGAGVDCTMLANVEDVECRAGKCYVTRCEMGYHRSLGASECVPVRHRRSTNQVRSHAKKQ